MEERSRAANESNARAWERQQEELRRARRIADSVRLWRQEKGLPVTAEDWRRIQEEAARQAARTTGGGRR